jgi:hypothetical protein
MSILSVNDLEGSIELNLTQEEIKNSPGLDEDQPISRQYELELGNYYGYAPYWTAENGIWGLYGSPSELVQHTHDHVEVHIDTNENSPLRSLKEVTGYHIHAKDGRIGHAEDFIICDRTWAIRSIEVDTKNFWPGKHVLFSPEWIKEISWVERAVYLGLTKENIEKGPESLPNEEKTYVK